MTTSLAIIVAGGLVEGAALGGLQAKGLKRVIPGLDAWRWLGVTTLVAGLGWAAASAPAALAIPDDSPGQSLLLLLMGAGGLGAAMGVVLGGTQATGLRGHVRHPWRWVGANALAWVPAMMVIFLGATTPAADWSGPAVLALGAVTGVAAGTALGLVSGRFIPALDAA